MDFRNHRDMRPSTTCWERRRITQKGAARRTARGINTINTRRCVELFVTLGLRPRKANASAKHVNDCMWGRKPQNTQNTPKGRLRRRTACDFTAKYRGASQARAVHATRAYMNRGLRSFHSLTPGCELSPFQGFTTSYKFTSVSEICKLSPLPGLGCSAEER